MSNKTYTDLLCETSELIGEATQADEAVFESGVVEKAALQPLLCELRVRYTVLLGRLDEVYDQLLQPQKRLIVKRLLEACLGRLLEIKQDLVEIQLSDFTFDSNEVLEKLQVTPYEAEPRVPQYFIREREDEILNNRQFVDYTLRRLGHEPAKPRALVLTEQQAVLVIQSHERARQGRLRELKDEILNNRQFVDYTLRRLGHEPAKPRALVLTEQQAVLVIQSHERARQGRLRLETIVFKRGVF
ncbi:unnamed protein product [Plutella xylostella]|uniref:(diamondback moth) hypothetical protein n=1 Tax=Plutella xylostella TaxID=51655 RepID=A0A8S4FKF8_PLUXY|nr:unnamed protein product [Plutella xylostella]